MPGVDGWILGMTTMGMMVIDGGGDRSGRLAGGCNGSWEEREESLLPARSQDLEVDAN